MRKAILNGILIVGISLTIHKGFSQTNNLYFNQVLLVGVTTMTVPANKVWKVEAYSQGGYYVSGPGTGCGASNYHHGFYVNGILCGFPYNQTYNYGPNSHFPLWLPAGTTLRTECSGDFLSVIEFNVAP
ncbi:MAG: hypothetical protein OHK0036_04570 [Bacteroidia bacterium]|jgi:hypothetical protein